MGGSVTPGPAAGRRESADVREVRAGLNRAARRLSVLELILLGATVIAALAGGWLAALLGAGAFGLPFRTTWMTASFALFIVPALLALGIGRFKRAGARKTAEAAGDRAPPEDGA